MTIKELLEQKRIILVCGSGGVGKTTTAASLALQGAALGRKTIVLTIDPAKRLANSLGLNTLSYAPQRLDPKKLERILKVDNPFCEAMMLDTKRTFDQLVCKYAPSKAVEKKILENKIYQHLSSMMAGSQEYMAMEKLYELSQVSDHELIIIDTPPTVHAIDFLEAPQKMVDAIGHSMLHLLLKPAMMMGKQGFKFFEKGSQMVLKMFDRITGFAFLQDISEMLVSFQDLLGGFKGRAEEVKGILTDSNTAFLMVCACEQKSVAEARYFSQKLEELKLPLAGLIINRVHPYYRVSEKRKTEDEETLTSLVGTSCAQKMLLCFDQYSALAKRDRSYIETLAKELDNDKCLVEIPLFDADIHDLEPLWALGKYFN